MLKWTLLTSETNNLSVTRYKNSILNTNYYTDILDNEFIINIMI